MGAMGNVFAAYHPVVGFAYLCTAIVFCMAAFHPVYVAISLLGALACSLVVSGPRRTGKALAFALPLGACITLGNLLLSAAGSTVLFSVGSHAFYLESACFGATMGCLFAAMMLWFASYAAVMDSEATTTLMGSALPTVSLMVSQVMGLVPQFLRRGRAIGAVQQASTAARVSGGDRRAERSRPSLRILSVLMSWGMEDGIVRADCMRARGYGCGLQRSRYRRQRFCWRDGIACATIALLAVANAALAAVACSQFDLYPTMDTLVPWWGYLPYLVMVLLPTLLAVREALLWNSGAPLNDGVPLKEVR